MGRDEVNSAGLALTIEGPGAVGYTLCLGLGQPQGDTGAFHEPSPLMTPSAALALWSACNTDPVSKAAARASMTPPVLAWFDTLSAAVTIGGQVYDLQARVLQAVRIGHRPLPPRLSANGLPIVV